MNEAEAAPKPKPEAAAAAATKPKPPGILFVALRSAGSAAALLALWAATDAWQAATGLALANALSVAVALLTGAGLTALAHEWGHWAGARLAGGATQLLPAARFIPLYDFAFVFQFDFARNNSAQFQAMSVGGNITTWLLALTLALALPFNAPGRAALVAAVVGFSIFTLVVEAPVMARVSRGEAPLQALRATITKARLRGGAIAGAVGALLFAAFAY